MPPATIQLASPQGIWRPVYARRIALHATADAIVLAAWQADADTLTLRPAVTAWRRSVGELDQSKVQRRQAASAVILTRLTARPWKRTRAALALAAQRAHHAGWQAGRHLATNASADDANYDDADDSDTGSGYILGSPYLSDTAAQSSATAALARLLSAAARRAGDAMDDSEDDPQQDAEDSIDTGPDVLLTADIATSAHYGLGLLAAYLAFGVQAVTWFTAGDQRVCNTCVANEAGGPYSPFAAPPLPAHPRCRCILAPA
jgi:hypothetical protein